MLLRWRPTLTTRPVLRQALSHGVSICVWCRSVMGWTLLSQFSVLFVVAKSLQLIFRTLSFQHLWPAFGGDHTGTLGEGRSQPNPRPPPLLFRPPPL